MVGMQTSGNYMTVLVTMSETLDSSSDRRQSYVNAVQVLREAMGASWAPSFLLNPAGSEAVLVTDAEHEERLGDQFFSLPAEVYVREPWVSPTGWPISAADHVGTEGWTRLPKAFRDWWGTSGVVVAVQAKRLHLGAVLLSFDRPVRLSQQQNQFLAAAGHLLGAAVNSWRSGQRQYELGALEERRWLADELHIDLSQQVAALGFQVAAMRLDQLSGSVGSWGADLARLEDMVSGLKHSLRHQMVGLRQDVNEMSQPFLELVERQVQTYRRLLGVPVELHCSQPAAIDAVPLQVAGQMVRVLQEAMANARWHAHASRISIHLEAGGDLVKLSVIDDGRGFDPAAMPDNRLGMRIMTERMQNIGGTLRVTSAPQHGTCVSAQVPVTLMVPQVQTVR
ncbi:MAG: ATP-binding protein [Micrococcales bacterium]|nr:ATP-binding protein [Micrococcales bacterium]